MCESRIVILQFWSGLELFYEFFVPAFLEKEESRVFVLAWLFFKQEIHISQTLRYIDLAKFNKKRDLLLDEEWSGTKERCI